MKITNGKVVVDVPEDKVAHYCLMMGYHLFKEAPAVEPEVITEPKPAARRGRPPKKAS